MTNGLEKAKKLTEAQMDGLRAIGSQGRPYPQKDQTMRALLRHGFAEYEKSSASWAITPLGLTALQQIEDQK